MFRGRIDDAAAARVEPGDRGGEDHAALTLLQFRQGRLGPEQATLDVDREQLVIGLAELVGRQFGKRGVNIEDAGIADENVEPAEGAHRLGDGALVVGE